MRYRYVIVGGTFDTLHKGHEAILDYAFEIAGQVTIALTSDQYVGKYKKALTETKSFSERKMQLELWVVNKGWKDRTRIVAIDDPFEPAASGAFDAIVVTKENKFRGNEINDMRIRRGLPPLVVVDIPMVVAQDGQPISSSRVRAGEIDKTGKLTMPESIRELLVQPLGNLIPDGEFTGRMAQQKGKLLITVGDKATKKFFDTGMYPQLAVIDLMVERKPFQKLTDYHFDSSYNLIHVASGPGFISKDAQGVIEFWGRAASSGVITRTVVVIQGEEDLLTLPAIIHAPLGSFVYYGQPGEGLIEVEVTGDTKQHATELLARFE